MIERRVLSVTSATLITFAHALGSMWMFSETRISWESWQVATCQSQEANCFCERIHTTGTKQPVNTSTSYAFVLIGLLIAFQELASRKSHIEQGGELGIFQSCFGLVYPVFLIIVGFGTAFYHATLTFLGQSIDIAGMYLVVLLYIVYRLARMRKWNLIQAVSFFGATCATLLVWATVFPSARRYIFAALIISTLALEVLHFNLRTARPNYRFLLLSVLALALGHVFWQLDFNGVLCDPLSVYQGHAAWHLLGALSAYLMYRFYRSELKL